MENHIDSTCMILNEEPVTNVLSLTIYRKRLTIADIIDKERYELFRELVRAVIVGAVGHYGRHAVSVVVCAYEVV